jgi:hypothetical protein
MACSFNRRENDVSYITSPMALLDRRTASYCTLSRAIHKKLPPSSQRTRLEHTNTQRSQPIHSLHKYGTYKYQTIGGQGNTFKKSKLTFKSKKRD